METRQIKKRGQSARCLSVTENLLPSECLGAEFFRASLSSDIFSQGAQVPRRCAIRFGEDTPPTFRAASATGLGTKGYAKLIKIFKMTKENERV